MSVKKGIEYALVVLVVVLIAAFAGGVAFLRWVHGFSARDEPAGFEKLLARRLRTLAHPANIRKLSNAVPGTPEVLSHARAHFADHCAVRHGNDGRSQTEISDTEPRRARARGSTYVARPSSAQSSSLMHHAGHAHWSRARR